MISPRLMAAIGMTLLWGCAGDSEAFRDLLRRGTQAYREGEFDGARQALSQALEVAPEHPGAHFQMAEVLYVQKEYDLALEHIEAAIRNDPPPPEFLYLNVKKQILLASERKAEACVVLEEMVRLDPGFTVGYQDLCKYYSDLHELDKLIEAARRTIEIDPDPHYPYFTSRIYFFRGKGYQKKEDSEKAEADFRKAIEICPTHSDPYYALHMLLARSGQEEEAAELKKVHEALRPIEVKIDEILTVIPNDRSRFPERLRNLIQLHLMLARYREAEKYCNSLLEAEPGTPDGLVWKGIIKKALKDDMTAERYLKEAIRNVPRFIGAYDELALLYARSEDERYRSTEKAWEVVEQAKTLGGVSPMTVAEVYWAEGKEDRAITTLRRALAKGDGDPQVIRQRITRMEEESRK